MNIARSGIKVFAARAVSSLVVFLGIAFFARELDSHQMGIFFLFQVTLGLISIPADFGVSTGLTKRLSEGESQESVLSTAILLKLFLLLPFISGIVLFQSSINNYLGADLALLLVPALVLQESAKLTIQTLKGELRVGEISGPMFSRDVVYIGIGITLISLGFKIRGIIYGLLLGFVVMLIWGRWKSSIELGFPSITHAQSLFSYSKYAFISSVGAYFYSWMDVAIIGFFLTQSDVAVYEIAWRVTAMVMLFSSSIATAIFPQVSQWDAADETDRIEALISEAVAPGLFIAVPAFFGVLLFPREILRFIFGAEYTTAWLVLIILMGEKVIQSVHLILGRSLQGINRPDLAAKAGAIAMVLNLVLNIVLILRYGIVGAAVATALSFTVNSFLHAYYLSNFVTIRIPYNQVGGFVAASVGMASTLAVIKSIVTIDSLLMLLVVVSLGVVLYSGFALVLPPSRRVILDNVRRIAR